MFDLVLTLFFMLFFDALFNMLLMLFFKCLLLLCSNYFWHCSLGGCLKLCLTCFWCYFFKCIKLLCSNYFWPFQLQLCLHLFCTWNQKEQLYLCWTCFAYSLLLSKMSHFAVSVQLCIVLMSNAFASCAMYHMLWLTDQWYMLTIHLWDGWIQMTMPLHNWIINCALFAVGLRIVVLSVQCQFDWSL